MRFVGLPIMCYELLPSQTLNSYLHFQQLHRRKETIVQKRLALANRRLIVLHQDKISPHTSLEAN